MGLFGTIVDTRPYEQGKSLQNRVWHGAENEQANGTGQITIADEVSCDAHEKAEGARELSLVAGCVMKAATRQTADFHKATPGIHGGIPEHSQE
jgi:hypothetical protein